MKITKLITVSLLLGTLLPVAAYAKHHHPPKVTDLSKTIPVSVIKPTTKIIVPNVTVIGNLSAVQATWIIPKTDGYISNINFSEGHYVKAGAVLIKLDDSKAKAQLASDQTSFIAADKQYQRQQKLAKSGYVSKEDLDNTKTTLAANQAAVAASQQALNDTKLKAPFSGYLGSKDINIGDYVQSAQKLVELVNKDTLKVIYNVPEVDIPKLKLGQQIGITSSEYPGRLFFAKVSYIAPEVDSNTGTVEVHALINNKDGALEPGGFVSVKQPLAKPKVELLIPNSAVMSSLDGSHVFLVKDNKAVKQAVKVGKQIAGYTTIKSGITPNSEIVVDGQNQLTAGQLVSTTPVAKGTFGKITDEDI